MSTVKANKWLHSDGTETTEVDVPSLDQRMAKAFVSFSGTTNALRNSYNVSSITDLAAGSYGVNYATAFANTDYCPLAVGETGAGDRALEVQTTSAGQTRMWNNVGGTQVDANEVHLVAFSN